MPQGAVWAALPHPFQAMNCRSDRVGWWRLPPSWLTWASLAALLGLQWLAVSWLPLRSLLGAVPLSSADWLTVMGAVVWPVLLLEAVKAWRLSGYRVGCPRPTSPAAGEEPGGEIPRNR